MKTEDFNIGETILVEVTDYNTIDEFTKPIKVIERLEVIIELKRGRKYINIDGEDCLLKNFKTGFIKGSTGMIRWKNSWLNCGFIVLGGRDFIRDEKLQQLGL